MKNFLCVLLFSLFFLVTGTAFASECSTCHEPDSKVENVNWSDVMNNFHIQAASPDVLLGPDLNMNGRAKKLDINGNVEIIGFYPRYVDTPCYTSTGLHEPNYTAEQRVHDSNLPLSDMIENSPGAIGLKGGEPSSGFSHSYPTESLC